MTGRALIVGGGPGGLAAAAGLQAIGMEVLIFERSPERGGGSGLTLWPNALSALGKLHLLDEIRERGKALWGIRMRLSNGAGLFSLSGSAMKEISDLEPLVLERSQLIEGLSGGLDKALRFGRRCVGFRQEKDRVEAFFDDGSSVAGDLLVGADGLRSTIRSQLFADRKLRYSGYAVFRGISRGGIAEKAGVTTMGRGAQFGYFPLLSQRVYWFASIDAGPYGRSYWKQELLARFSSWHQPVPSLIERTRESDLLRNDVYDLDPLEKWGSNRVTLLGDAAHPFQPTLGQGACQAFEDAAVLVRALDESSCVRSALGSYQNRRRSRTRSIVLQSRQIGRIGQWRHPLACWFRNRLIRHMPLRVRIHQLRTMFDFQG